MGIKKNGSFHLTSLSQLYNLKLQMIFYLPVRSLLSTIIVQGSHSQIVYVNPDWSTPERKEVLGHSKMTSDIQLHPIPYALICVMTTKIQTIEGGQKTSSFLRRANIIFLLNTQLFVLTLYNTIMILYFMYSFV